MTVVIKLKNKKEELIFENCEFVWLNRDALMITVYNSNTAVLLAQFKNVEYVYYKKELNNEQ